MKNFMKASSILPIAMIVATASAAPLTKHQGYAEKIYIEYAMAAGGQIEFDVTERAHGPIIDLQGRAFASIVGTPSKILAMSDFDGLVGRNLNYVKTDQAMPLLADLNRTVEEFAEVGYALKGGTFRLLDVIVFLNGISESHKSLEFCWPAQSHCVLLEPTIEFADSIANTRIRLIAEGNVPKFSGELPDASRATACRLASDTRLISKKLTWNPRSLSGQNALGGTLWTKSLGGVEAGVRCDSSCKPQPFGQASASSGRGYLGYSVACTFSSTGGVTGTTARDVGLSICNHRFGLGATASISVGGTGASITLSPGGNGTTSSNGGSFTDSCGIFQVR